MQVPFENGNISSRFLRIENDPNFYIPEPNIFPPFAYRISPVFGSPLNFLTQV